MQKRSREVLKNLADLFLIMIDMLPWQWAPDPQETIAGTVLIDRVGRAIRLDVAAAGRRLERVDVEQPAGSAVHLCYGTQRISVNLLEFWGFSGKAGGKGGKGLGGSGGKKGSNQQYSVNVAFGLCQGPVSFQDGAGQDLRIWANGGIATGLGP